MPLAARLAVVAVLGLLLVSTAAAVGAPALGHRAGAPPLPARPSGSAAASTWPTYSYDVERTGANLADHDIGPLNVSELQPLWSLPSNGSDFSAPIVVGGTVYFGSWNGDEYAVNATTGAVAWERYLGTTSCNGGGYSPQGISSTATYDNGTLYLGGGNMTWYALNATTGAVDWSYLAGTPTLNYYDWASALVYGGSLYIGLSSCFDNPLVPAGLVEVNLTSHAATATFDSSPPGQIGESIWTTPALDPQNRTIWLATGN